MVLKTMLQLPDRAVVGHAPRFAGCFNAHVLCASNLIEHLEHLRPPPLAIGFGHDPELS